MAVQSVVATQVEGWGRVVDALHLALPADAAAVLSGLADTDLAAGVLAAEHPLAVAVTEHLTACGGAPAAALADCALAGRTVADPDAVLRALIGLADPAVDRALFFPRRASPRLWVRKAIVRSRRGPDGRAVIDAELRARLIEQVDRIEQRIAGRSSDKYLPTIEQELLAAALGADDPELALAALPTAVLAGHRSGAACALLTLHAHGRLADVRIDHLRRRFALGEGLRPYDKWPWDAAARLADGAAGIDDETVAKAFPGGIDKYLAQIPGEAYSWYAPGAVSRRHVPAWDQVVAFAATSRGGIPSRGLDEAAAREDTPDEVRAELAAYYPRGALFVARPDVDALLAAQRVARETLSPAKRHMAVRQVLLRGLVHHTLSAEDVLRHAEPATDVLGLMTPPSEAAARYYSRARDQEPDDGDEIPRHQADNTAFHRHRLEHDVRRPKFALHAIPDVAVERCRADLRAAVADLLAVTFGDDAERWRALLVRVGAWAGSFESLVWKVARDSDVPLPAERAHRWPRGLDAAAVLMACAPDTVAEALFTEAGAGAAGGPDAGSPAEPSASAAPPAPKRHPHTPLAQGLLTRMLDRGPLSPAVVDLALGPGGTPAMRRALARNPDTDLSLLWRIVQRDPAEPEVLATAYFHRAATEDLRARVILRSEAAGGLHRRLLARLATIEADLDLLRPALASQDPVLLHSLLRRTNSRIDPGHRTAAYASLARLAGPEAVWALELERVGALERMSGAVRASMASGDGGPLFEAADIAIRPAFLTRELSTLPDGDGDGDSDSGGVAEPSFAELARTALDGRPDRWRAFAAALAAAPGEPPGKLLARGTTEAPAP